MGARRRWSRCQQKPGFCTGILAGDVIHVGAPQLSGLTTAAIGGGVVVVAEPDARHQVATGHKADKPEVAVVVGGASFARFPQAQVSAAPGAALDHALHQARQSLGDLRRNGLLVSVAGLPKFVDDAAAIGIVGISAVAAVKHPPNAVGGGFQMPSLAIAPKAPVNSSGVTSLSPNTSPGAGFSSLSMPNL